MLYNRAQPTVLSLLTCFQFSNIVRPLGGCGVKIQNVNANYLAKVKSNTWLEPSAKDQHGLQSLVLE